jgi:hypothetical protein
MDFILRICHCNWILSVLGMRKRAEEDLNSGRYNTIPRSPSNYCRVATCEMFHIHEITPKCLETFAPSSTCSSCQNCDTIHIGPNHSQLVNNWIAADYEVPDYNPQQSPDHTYSFDFNNLLN